MKKSSEQLMSIREQSIRYLNRHGENYPISFTCDKCSIKFSCKFAFDPYNINDECIVK